MDPKPYIPRTLRQFPAAVSGLVPQTRLCLAPIAPTRICYLKSWRRGGETVLGFNMEHGYVIMSPEVN